MWVTTDAPFLQWEEFNGTGWSVLSDGGNYIGANTTRAEGLHCRFEHDRIPVPCKGDG